MLLSAPLFLALFAGPAEAATLDVCPSGCTYDQISAAVVAASDTDEIVVSTGDYGAFAVDKSVTIRWDGSGGRPTVKGAGDVVVVEPSSFSGNAITVVIEGLSLIPVDTRGMRVAGAVTATLTDLVLKDVQTQRPGPALKVENGADVTAVATLFEAGDAGLGNTGGLMHVSGQSVLRVVDCTVKKGLAAAGGAVYVHNSDLVVSGGVWTDHNAQLGNGGAIYAEAFSSVTIDSDALIEGSQALVSGGHVFADRTTVLVENASLLDGTAQLGGAVYASGGQVTVRDATVTKANGVQRGGYFYQSGGTLTVERSSLEGSTVSFEGGAIYGSAATVVLTDLAILGNAAGLDGGGVYLTGASRLDASEVTFRQNRGWHGGGVYLGPDAGGAVVLSDFEANQATGWGGGLGHDSDADLLIADSTFFDNRAPSGAGVGWSGGPGPLALTLTDDVFERNSSSGLGGGLWVGAGGDVVLTDTLFAGNQAATGGGVALDGIRSVDVLRSTWCSNRSTFDGGGAIAVQVTGAQRWENAVFLENTSGGVGGGLRVTRSAGVEVVNSDFLGNGSQVGGGGGANVDQTPLVFENNLVAFTTAGDGLRTTLVGAPVESHNAWFGNGSVHASGQIDTSGLNGSDLVGVDPALQGFVLDGKCDDLLWPEWDSPLLDAGDPTTSDPADTIPSLITPSDIGALGGPEADPVAWADADGDGFPFMWDCDDDEPLAYPTAIEVCDGVDNDCDGLIDIGAVDQTMWYRDNDADGWGADSGPGVLACQGPPGSSDQVDDCDDGDATRYPGAPELCDGLVNDCDGTLPAAEADADVDGYVICAIDPGGWRGAVGVIGGGDCDDTDGTAHPTAPELCDGVDNACAGTLPGNEEDDDGDGYVECSIDSGGWQGATPVTGGEDCDDADDGDGVTVFPGAPELCDGLINDCYGVLPAAEADDDGDGYVECSLDGGGWDGVGVVLGGDDCDDRDDTHGITIFPGAPERCDGLVNACGTALSMDEVDDDGDGRVECAIDAGGWDGVVGVTGGEDCDDAEDTVFPGASERCDGQLNDCDGSLSTTEVDDDTDGFVECAVDAGGWDGPIGVTGGGDCNDADDTVFPAATERCDGQINACGGDLLLEEADDDSDGYVECAIDGGGWDGVDTVVGGLDCLDTNAAVYPGAPELCDGIDTDCDTLVGAQEDDDDDDGYVTCAVDAGGWFGPPITGGGDCNDADVTVYPGASELCDGQDDDCDATLPTDEVDDDGDGYVECVVDTNGWDGDLSVVGGEDCDDARALDHPGAPEICNDGFDNDCDGTVDESTGDQTWHQDSDGDGYGDPGTTFVDCAPPDESWLLDGTDCDDTDASIHPGADDILADGIDQDCDGRDAAPADSSRSWEPDGGDIDQASAGCDCATSPSRALGAWPLLFGLLALRRRRDPTCRQLGERG